MTQLCQASATLFKRRHFDGEIIIRCGRWYLTYKLSYRDLRAMMAERGIDVAHTTIMRWVQRFKRFAQTRDRFRAGRGKQSRIIPR
jgi:transposase-like protein